MARALFGILAAAMLGLTGYYAYVSHNVDHPVADETGVATVKKGCCAQSAKPSCCQESSDAAACTGTCQGADDKKDDTSTCCQDKKEGGCCTDKDKDKKDATEPKKD